MTNKQIKARILLSLQKDMVSLINSGCSAKDIQECIVWLEEQDKNQNLIETRVMDYEKKYKKALEIIKGSVDTLNEIYKAGTDVVNIQSIKNCFYRAFPELEESDKEVDLNTAVADYIIKHTSEVSGYFDIRRIASHFFDLGLKAQKGE